MIRGVKAAKIKVLDVPGKVHNSVDKLVETKEFAQTALMNESFMMVAAHIDNSLRKRIENGEYVDFSRLLPRDRISEEQNNRLEWVQDLNGGGTFRQPVSERNASS